MLNKKRDPNRIYEFCKQFQAVWGTMPDMRFGQMIAMIECYLPKGVDPFQAEESQWQEAIKLASMSRRYVAGVANE